MIIENVVVKDYKILKDLNLHVNPETNILVGDNGSGKSTIMSAINLALLGRIGESISNIRCQWTILMLKFDLIIDRLIRHYPISCRR